MTTKPQFEVIRMQPENTNSVLVSCGTDCVIFDPWGHVDAWQELLNARHLHLVAIYATHGHSDHISAAPQLAAAYNVPWYLNPRDNDLILWGNPILDMFQLPNIPADYTRPTPLGAGTVKILDGLDMNIIETAGHSAGGMTYHFPDYGILITGDTIFRDGVGRCDLPTGDVKQLRTSIDKIYDMNLPNETYVVHGHGLDSTIGILKESNPYFVPKSACRTKCEVFHGCGCGCGHCHDDDD